MVLCQLTWNFRENLCKCDGVGFKIFMQFLPRFFGESTSSGFPSTGILLNKHKTIKTKFLNQFL